MMTTNLSLENSLPNIVCVGIRMKKTAIPARHDGPIQYINNIITIAACRGVIHRKCRYKVTWEKMTKMECRVCRHLRPYICTLKSIKTKHFDGALILQHYIMYRSS